MQRFIGLFLWELSFAVIGMGAGMVFVFSGLRLGADEFRALVPYGWLYVILLLTVGFWRVIAELIARRLSQDGQ